MSNLRICYESSFWIYLQVNALWYIMSGKRYAHDDVKQTTILDDANE
jgi:hypothetical protein